MFQLDAFLVWMEAGGAQSLPASGCCTAKSLLTVFGLSFVALYMLCFGSNWGLGRGKSYFSRSGVPLFRGDLSQGSLVSVEKRWSKYVAGCLQSWHVSEVHVWEASLLCSAEVDLRQRTRFVNRSNTFFTADFGWHLRCVSRVKVTTWFCFWVGFGSFRKPFYSLCLTQEGNFPC